MERKTMLWIAIGILFVVTLFITFKAGGVDVNTVQTAASTASSTAQAASSGMVGGC